jgi:hypothetical protein
MRLRATQEAEGRQTGCACAPNHTDIAALMLGGSKGNPKGVPGLSLVVGGVDSLTADLSQSGRKTAYIVQQGQLSVR